MRLYVVAYPELEDEDLQRIEDCCKENDRLYGLVPPHFTLVFLVEDFTPQDFIAEIKKQIGNTNAFAFALRCAVVNQDAFSENYFAFLVPDEGFSNMVKLHDRLYDDKLFHHRRLDIDYIPHVEIANSADKMRLKRLADDWNKTDFTIRGKVSSIDIIRFENKVLTTIEKIMLCR